MDHKLKLPRFYFFVYDQKIGSSGGDDRDSVPEAILYFYPKLQQCEHEVTNLCGNLAGIIQYLNSQFLLSKIRTFTFDKTLVTHRYYGRHFALLCFPKHEIISSEEITLYLKQTLDLFHLLYGTFNHVTTKYPDQEQLRIFLSETMTPIIEQTFSVQGNLGQLLSAVDYVSYIKGYRRHVVDSIHFLDHLKSVWSVQNSLIGFEKRILFSTFDADTLFLFQSLLEMRKTLPASLIKYELKDVPLHSGVTLFRIYLPGVKFESIQSETSPISLPIRPPSKPGQFLSLLSPSSEEDPRTEMSFSPTSFDSLSSTHRFGRFIGNIRNSSSDDNGIRTDYSTSDMETNETVKFPVNPEPQEYPQSQRVLFRSKNSLLTRQSSTSSFDSDEIQSSDGFTPDESTDGLKQITFSEISYDEDSDPLSSSLSETNNDYVRSRTSTITIPPLSDLKNRQRPLLNRQKIPDENNEEQRSSFILYYQHNGRMVYAGLVDQNILNEQYLAQLWHLIINRFSIMEPDILTIREKEATSLSREAKLEYNRQSHRAEIEANSDMKLLMAKKGPMAFVAGQMLRKRNDRKFIALSQGATWLSIKLISSNQEKYSVFESIDE